MLLVANLAMQNDEKKLQKIPETLLLEMARTRVTLWEQSARTIQWITTRQGLDGFQKSLCPCAWGEK